MSKHTGKKKVGDSKGCLPLPLRLYFWYTRVKEFADKRKKKAADSGTISM